MRKFTSAAKGGGPIEVARHYEGGLPSLGKETISGLVFF